MPSPLLRHLQRLERSAHARIHLFTAHRGWWIYTGLTAAVLTLIIASPSPRAFDSQLAGHASHVLAAVEAPFTYRELPARSHGAKRQFRLTMPMIMRTFGLGIAGAKVLEMLLGIGTLIAVACIGWRTCRDRVAAAWLTLAVAFIFAGFTAFTDEETTYDGVAIFFLTLACASNRWWIVAPAIWCAAWTDERGLIMSSFVFLYHLCRHQREGKPLLRFFLRGPIAIAIFGCWIVYFATRGWLHYRFGMSTPAIDTLSYLSAHLQTIPLGLWTTFEGLWLVVLASLAICWRAGERFTVLLAVAGYLLATYVSFSVLDISRSLAYALPGLFVAMQGLGGRLPRWTMRRLLFTAALLCLLWPPLYVQYTDTAWRVGTWLPINLLDWWTLYVANR